MQGAASDYDDQGDKLRGSSINRAVIAVKNFLSYGKFGTRTRTIVAVTFLICFLLVYVFSPGPTTFEAAPAQPPPIPLSNSTGAQIESQPPVDRYKSDGGGTRALLPSHASNCGYRGAARGLQLRQPTNARDDGHNDRCNCCLFQGHFVGV